MDRDKLYIEHILSAIQNIEEYVKDFSRAKFLEKKNHMIQNAVIRELEVVGEAVKHLSSNLKQENRSLPWREIEGMRNKLIHEYFSVNLNTVWQTVQKDLPILKEAMMKLRELIEA